MTLKVWSKEAQTHIVIISKPRPEVE